MSFALADSESVLIICGPTAIGKTGVAMAVQDALGGSHRAQLISADSALIYRGMDIGTAKPSTEELRAYPHKLIDIRDPSEAYSAAEFVADVDAAIVEAIAAGKKPIVVGGTMMYLKCMLEGIASLPSTDENMRAVLQQELEEKGATVLHDELMRQDPRAAANIHPNNHQRLMRALAVIRETGSPLSAQWASHAGGTLYERTGHRSQTVIMLPKDRGVLHQRIGERFEQMLQQGFLAEVEALVSRRDLHRGMPSMRAVGYRQAVAHLMGECDYAEFVQKGLAATRQLAKRQLTWLKKWPDATPVVSDDPDDARNVVLTGFIG